MSWSASAAGTPAGVADQIAEIAGSQKCIEPEESIKAGIVAAVRGAISAFPADAMVSVTMSGHQSGPADENGKARNTLSVKIEPLQR